MIVISNNARNVCLHVIVWKLGHSAFSSYYVMPYQTIFSKPKSFDTQWILFLCTFYQNSDFIITMPFFLYKFRTEKLQVRITLYIYVNGSVRIIKPQSDKHLSTLSRTIVHLQLYINFAFTLSLIFFLWAFKNKLLNFTHFSHFKLSSFKQFCTLFNCVLRITIIDLKHFTINCDAINGRILHMRIGTHLDYTMILRL